MSNVISDIVFEAGDRISPLIVKRYSRAHGLRLRVDPRDGRVLLTMPKCGSLRKACRWAETKRDWVEAEMAKIADKLFIAPGVIIPFRGNDLRIVWNAELSRHPVINDGCLQIGGGESELSNRVVRWLKSEARTRLAWETQRYADLAGVTVGRVSIGDARTRWGSCSSSGAIRYSWRLIMTPAEVLSATVAHEVAHRVHMNHSPEFHALVAELFGREPTAERKWLRENGPSLYRIVYSS